MSLPTPSQSVSHKWFHQCVNHKKEAWGVLYQCLVVLAFSRHPFDSGLITDKVLQKLTKSYKSEIRHLFQCCILILRKCPRKTPFQHTVLPSPNHRTFRRFWIYAGRVGSGHLGQICKRGQAGHAWKDGLNKTWISISKIQLSIILNSGLFLKNSSKELSIYDSFVNYFGSWEENNFSQNTNISLLTSCVLQGIS